MPRGNYKIQRVCEECGKIFTPPTLISKYCCSACSKKAYKKRQIAKEKGLLPSHNFGQRQTRLSRQYMDEHFKKKPRQRNKKKEAFSFDSKDCYTIGQIAQKFHINEGTVLTHIRRNSIPTRQIGNYVYVPKTEIDKLYKSL